MARGAPTQVAGHSVGTVVPAQRGGVLLSLPARTGRVPWSKTVIHKVLGVTGNGLQVQSPTVICAGRSSTAFSEPSCRPKGTPALRRYNCSRMICHTSVLALFGPIVLLA